MMRSTQYWLGILICFWLVPHGALHAQENGSYTIRQALAIDWVTKDFNPAVKLYWATETAPEFAELSRPEVVSSSGISNNPLAGRGRCYEAFRDSVKALIKSALERGYDAVIGIRHAWWAARSRACTRSNGKCDCRSGRCRTTCGCGRNRRNTLPCWVTSLVDVRLLHGRRRRHARNLNTISARALTRLRQAPAGR